MAFAGIFSGMLTDLPLSRSAPLTVAFYPDLNNLGWASLPKPVNDVMGEQTNRQDVDKQTGMELVLKVSSSALASVP